MTVIVQPVSNGTALGAVGLYAGAGTGKLLSTHATLQDASAEAAARKLKTFTCKIAGMWTPPPPTP